MVEGIGYEDKVLQFSTQNQKERITVETPMSSLKKTLNVNYKIQLISRKSLFNFRGCFNMDYRRKLIDCPEHGVIVQALMRDSIKPLEKLDKLGGQRFADWWGVAAEKIMGSTCKMVQMDIKEWRKINDIFNFEKKAKSIPSLLQSDYKSRALNKLICQEAHLLLQDGYIVMEAIHFPSFITKSKEKLEMLEKDPDSMFMDLACQIEALTFCEKVISNFELLLKQVKQQQLRRGEEEALRIRDELIKQEEDRKNEDSKRQFKNSGESKAVSEEELRSEMESKVRRELKAEMESDVRGQLKVEMELQVRRELWAEMESEVRGKLMVEMEFEVRREMKAEMESEVRREMKVEMELEVRRELRVEIESKVRGDLRAEMDSAVREGLRAELKHEVREGLRVELEADVREKSRVGLERELRMELVPRLREELGAELRPRLREEQRDIIESEYRWKRYVWSMYDSYLQNREFTVSLRENRMKRREDYYHALGLGEHVLGPDFL